MTRYQHERIDRAKYFRQRTGACVICRHLQAEPERMTCGRMACLVAWLSGQIPRVEIIVDSIEKA